ncbi:galactosylceramide sulfotransferase-like [Branchiostoma floridae x Branchiostoma japonicum]
MNYYSLPKLLKIESKNPVKTFLQDPWKYKDLSEAYFDFGNVTWDGTRNFLSFDLGYPTEGAEDKERARRYISELEADFTLVLLLEHLDESLVLLRRLMCWEVRDVLYDVEGKNNRTYRYKSYTPTAEELTNLRRWKVVDYLLYDTFNASLWRKIAAQGPDFYEELHYFREVRKCVSKFCHTLKRHQQPLIINASKWSPQFAVNSMYCRGLQTRDIPLGEYIRKRASVKNKKEWRTLEVRENMNRIIQGLPAVKYKYEAEAKKET